MTTLAVLPSARNGETVLLGTSSDGSPFTIRHSDSSVDVSAVTERGFPSEIEQMLIEQFGSTDEPMDQTSYGDQQRGPPLHIALSTILDVARTVGWRKVKQMDKAGTWISFFVTDDRYRKHTIKYTLIDSDGTLMQVEVDLPQPFIQEARPVSDARDIYDQFVIKIDDYQLFWNDMSELDEALTVLDPERPGFADTHRAIYLESQVALEFTINPTTPRVMSELIVVGPEAKKRAYQNRVDEAVDTWAEDFSLLKNLSSIFGQFGTPGPQTQLCLQRQVPVASDAQGKDEEEMVRCELCYLGDEPPDKKCRRCHRQYHGECLKECLKRQAAKRATFNDTVYRCPTCGNGISAKITKE